MSRLSANRNDHRRFSTTQGVERSYGGIPMEQGASGSDLLLPIVLDGNVYFNADAGVKTAQVVGDLPPGVWVDGCINHKALTGGTCQIDLPLHKGATALNLVAAGAVLNAAATFTMANSLYAPTTFSRPVSITITGGTAGETALISLRVHAVDNGWY